MASPPYRRPLPTAVQRAMQEGFGKKPEPSEPTGRAPTENGAIPRAVDVDDEDSSAVLVGMSHHDGLIYRLDQLKANDIELARGLGAVQRDVTVTSARLGELVGFASKADDREERREFAKAALATQLEAAKMTARAEESKAGTARMTSREKILVTVLVTIGSVLTGYFATRPTTQIVQQTAPAPTTQPAPAPTPR